MNSSEEIKDLAAALAKAQGEIRNAPKDSNNPHFKAKYADLASVWSVAREPLSKNGLSIIQMAEDGPDTIRVTTRLLHSSGQWIESSLSMTPMQKTPQGIGSCITYARRYGLAAMVGVAPDDDDDANLASAPAFQPQGQKQPQNVTPIRKTETPPEAEKQDQIWKTFDEWKALNRFVKKGEKSTRINGVSKFNENQVFEKKISTEPSFDSHPSIAPFGPEDYDPDYDPDMASYY